MPFEKTQVLANAVSLRGPAYCRKKALTIPARAFISHIQFLVCRFYGSDVRINALIPVKEAFHINLIADV